MANTFKVLSRVAAQLTSQTLYTVPASTTTLISSAIVTNTASTAATFNMLLNDVSVATLVPIPANDSVMIDMKQVLATGQTIKAFASATTVNFHISGLEIT